MQRRCASTTDTATVVRSTADLMKSMEGRLVEYALSDDAGCGELLRKALRYAWAEWPAMKRVLESGDVEISNNISEQRVRKLKMNLRNAGKYISCLLGKLKTAREGEDLTSLLPCYCGL